MGGIRRGPCGPGGIKGPPGGVGVVSRAASFDGVDQWLGIDDGADQITDYPFSMVCWFKTTTDPGATGKMLMFIGDKDDFDNTQSLAINTNNVVGSSSRSTGTSSATNDTYDPWDGKWHFAAYVVSASDSRRIAFDDTEGSVESTDVVIQNVYDRTELGRRGIGGAFPPDRYFDGAIDGAMIFDDALTVAETLWLYNSGSGRTKSAIENSGDADNPGTDNLPMHWNLNETSGTRADDEGSMDLTDNNDVPSVPGLI